MNVSATAAAAAAVPPNVLRCCLLCNSQGFHTRDERLHLRFEAVFEAV